MGDRKGRAKNNDDEDEDEDEDEDNDVDSDNSDVASGSGKDPLLTNDPRTSPPTVDSGVNLSGPVTDL